MVGRRLPTESPGLGPYLVLFAFGKLRASILTVYILRVHLHAACLYLSNHGSPTPTSPSGTSVTSEITVISIIGKYHSAHDEWAVEMSLSHKWIIYLLGNFQVSAFSIQGMSSLLNKGKSPWAIPCIGCSTLKFCFVASHTLSVLIK